MSILDNLFNFLFPHTCVICDKVGDDVCDYCLDKISLRNALNCLECGMSSKDGVTHPKCKKLLGLDGLWVLYPYSPTIRTIIHASKYKNVRGALAKLINRQKVQMKLSKYHSVIGQITLIAPIPLSKRKEVGRGFNQSEYIANEFSKYFSIPCDSSVISRVRDSKPQSTFRNKRDREHNVSGIFKITKEIEQGAVVILVDDILTSGATMREACKELKSRAVVQVYGLALSGKI